VLENAFRISLGQVPYRDFPFPYAPLAFLVQAAIIKLTGRVFWHTIVYCAIVGGTGTFLIWRTVRNRLDNVVTKGRQLSFLMLFEGLIRASIRHDLTILASALTTLAIAIVLIHFTADMKNY